MLVRQFPFTGGPPCCSFLSCSAVASHCFASIYFGWSSIFQYFVYFLLFWSILLVSILLVLPFLFQAYFSRLSSLVDNVRVGCSCSEPCESHRLVSLQLKPPPASASFPVVLQIVRQCCSNSSASAARYLFHLVARESVCSSCLAVGSR